MVKYLIVAARVVAMGAILFFAIFALDIFEPNRSFIEIFMALFIHLIPSLVLLLVLLLSFKAKILSGLIFIILAFVPFFFLRDHIWVNIMLASPIFIAGCLFLLGGWLEKK